MSDSENNYQHIGAYPTVSAEKWKQHAIKKLSKGYLLIVSNTRNYANFYRGHENFESCSFRTARKLLREGLLVECGTHMLGTIYQLKDEFKFVIEPKDLVFAPQMRVIDPDMEDMEDVTDAEDMDDMEGGSDSMDDYMGSDFLLDDGDSDTDDYNSLAE